jgi:SAM-dependent methyltransferase
MRLSCPILDDATEVAPTAYSRDPWTVVRCRSTDLVFLANPPAYSQLAEQYAWEKTCREETLRRRANQPIAWRLSEAIKRLRHALFPRRNRFLALARQVAVEDLGDRSLRFLDVGCGCGALMKKYQQSLQARGVEAVPIGIEVSHQLASAAQRQVDEFGGKVLVTNSIDGAAQLESRSIDLVLMASFLEHEFQPRRLFRELHRVLAEDGVMVVKVPNFASWNRVVRGKKWSGFRYPDHVSYFTPRTLALLAEKENFLVARQTLRDKFPLNDNMYAVLKKAA